MSQSTNITLTSYGITDRGLVRAENEDNLYVSDHFQVYAVADGLGGLPEGALASTLAITSLEEQLHDCNGTIPLKEIFEQVHNRVCKEGLRISDDIGIGTTLTIAHIAENQIRIAHAGDTGIYLFREGEIYKLTVDHTMAQEMLENMKEDEQEQIPDYFYHTLTRCVGQTGDIDIDLYEFDLQAGDRILIYSDGITKTVETDELNTMVSEHSDPESYIKQLIKLANQRGGPDNITAIAIYID